MMNTPGGGSHEGGAALDRAAFNSSKVLKLTEALALNV
jgi:hypothetical protein